MLSQMPHELSQFYYMVEKPLSNLPANNFMYVGREILYQLLDLQFTAKAKINNYCLKELQKVQTYDPKPCIYEL